MIITYLILKLSGIGKFRVAGLRAVKKSASGKSVDLEIKRRFRDWESNDWKFDIVKAERVRFDKVETFLRRNRKFIG